MKLAIGGDHAGFDYKQSIYQHLDSSGHDIQDFGTHDPSSVDYPDFAHPVASYVEANPDSLGILVCGSGNGVAMVANKHAGIRAALCWNEELAKLARQHNNANVLCIPARFVSPEMTRAMIDVFLSEPFEGGRHANRVGKISC
ncbi:MAG: ribose 5-phosphate isomerase B [Cyclobacteriaceae bacterium]|nr:MAG: ribose 5-phosphate isomerase B [Cyclobacteriaceae bacterium]